MSTKNKAIALYKSDKSSIDIETLLGINSRTVRTWVLEAGVSRGRRVVAKANLKKAHEILRTSNLKQNFRDITDDLCYIVGVLLGDGSISKLYSIRLGTIDEEFLDVFLDALDNQFGRKTWKLKIPANSRTFPAGKTYLVKAQFVGGITSKLAAEFLRETLNQNWICCVDISMKVSIIRGLWDSEGCVRRKRKHGNSWEVIFYNTQEWIARLFLNLLDEIQVKATIQFNEQRQLWVVRFGKLIDVIRFYQLIRPTIKRKRARFEEALARWRASQSEN